MQKRITLQDKILDMNDFNLQEIILEVFDYQSLFNPVYAEFIRLLGKSRESVRALNEIPFLPIQLFKTLEIKTGEWSAEQTFESSGTGQHGVSKHAIASLDFYHKITRHCFQMHFGSILQYEFVGLLPNYLEKPNSSLVSMLQFFINESNDISENSFFLYDFSALNRHLNALKKAKRKVILFGVSFALLDFVAEYQIEFEQLIIIETGGMKNRQRNIERSELLTALKKGFPLSKIVSEYGMTEMLSQAYALDAIEYRGTPFLKFLISDPTDPMQFLETGRRGIINVMDLANIHSCSFLQTEDIGILNENGNLQVLGRFNPEDTRGCVQMYEG